MFDPTTEEILDYTLAHPGKFNSIEDARAALIAEEIARRKAETEAKAKRQEATREAMNAKLDEYVKAQFNKTIFLHLDGQRSKDHKNPKCSCGEVLEIRGKFREVAEAIMRNPSQPAFVRTAIKCGRCKESHALFIQMVVP